MKKVSLLIAMAFMMSPMLHATTTTDCRSFAQEAADQEWGSTVNSEVEYYYAYAEWFDMCDSMN